MKPSFRRNHDRTRPPIHPRHFLSFRPEERITFAGENEDVRAGTVPMRLFVNTDRKARYVRAHHAFRHLEKNRRVAFAALGPSHRLDVDRIRDKIGFYDAIAVKFAAAGKITVFASEP